MKRKTRSLFQEIDQIYIGNDRKMVIETRSDHLINGVINLIKELHREYTPEQANELERRLVNSIRGKDPNKFKRGLNKFNENK
tara:strand:+ start:219 stop:467 length:249 start_codon:yes stop_codon:yes gene_type:complete